MLDNKNDGPASNSEDLWTRREVLTLGSSRKRAAEVDKGTRSKAPASVTGIRPVRRVLVTTAVLAVIISGVWMASAPVGAVTGSPSSSGGAMSAMSSVTVAEEANASVTPAEATQAKQDAQQRLKRLQDLNENHSDLVSDEVIASVQDKIAHGDTAADLNRWAEAKQAYVQASEQARGALRTFYRQATQDDLAAAQQAIDKQGDNDPGLAKEFSNRHDHITTDLRNATSVGDLRGVHNRGHTLANDVTALQPSLLARAINAIPLLVGGALIVVSLYAVWLRVRGPTSGGRPDKGAVAYRPDREDER